MNCSRLIIGSVSQRRACNRLRSPGTQLCLNNEMDPEKGGYNVPADRMTVRTKYGALLMQKLNFQALVKGKEREGIQRHKRVIYSTVFVNKI